MNAIENIEWYTT